MCGRMHLQKEHVEMFDILHVNTGKSHAKCLFVHPSNCCGFDADRSRIARQLQNQFVIDAAGEAVMAAELTSSN